MYFQAGSASPINKTQHHLKLIKYFTLLSPSPPPHLRGKDFYSSTFVLNCSYFTSISTRILLLQPNKLFQTHRHKAENSFSVDLLELRGPHRHMRILQSTHLAWMVPRWRQKAAGPNVWDFLKGDTCWALICREQQMFLCRRSFTPQTQKREHVFGLMKNSITSGRKGCEDNGQRFLLHSNIF